MFNWKKKLQFTLDVSAISYWSYKIFENALKKNSQVAILVMIATKLIKNPLKFSRVKGNIIKSLKDYKNKLS